LYAHSAEGALKIGIISFSIAVLAREFGVTSHIARVWEWGCTYMYIHTLLDTTCFKALMALNLSELRS